MQHFLLVFNHNTGVLDDIREFGTDSDKAVTAYSALEEQYREEPRMEIVLIGSDSLETVKMTHANYFDGGVSSSKYLHELEKWLSSLTVSR